MNSGSANCARAIAASPRWVATRYISLKARTVSEGHDCGQHFHPRDEIDPSLPGNRLRTHWDPHGPDLRGLRLPSSAGGTPDPIGLPPPLTFGSLGCHAE